MGCTGCSGWKSRKSFTAEVAEGCAVVKTPELKYGDAAEESACTGVSACEGDATFTRPHTQGPNTSITRQHFRQPIRILLRKIREEIVRTAAVSFRLRLYV